METKVDKTVVAKVKAKRGADITVRGGKGMTTLKCNNLEFVFYTDEIPDLISVLTEYQKLMDAKQEL